MRWILAGALVLIAGCGDGEDDPSPAETACAAVAEDHSAHVHSAGEAADAGDLETMYHHALAEALIVLQNQPCFAEFAVNDARRYVEEHGG